MSHDYFTTRRYARTRRDAELRWPESALGINGPVIQTDTSIIARILRVVARTWARVRSEWR